MNVGERDNSVLKHIIEYCAQINVTVGKKVEIRFV